MENASIIPNARIEALDDFYASRGGTSSDILEEDLPALFITDDQKGSWCTDQIKSAATTLSVFQFIEPIAKGGVNVPDIPDQSAYAKAHLQERAEAVEDLREKLAVRKLFLEMALQDVHVAKEHLNALVGSVVHIPQLEEGMSEADIAAVQKEYAKVVKKRDAAIILAQTEYRQAYQQWATEERDNSRDKDRVVAFEQDALKKGREQQLADSDARKGAMKALGSLKKFASSHLLKKYPGLEVVMRKIGELKVDPYETSDMRGVYGNLIARFKKDNDLGVTSSIMELMQKFQGDEEALEAYWAQFEKFNTSMAAIGITHISVEDLSAMMALVGMHDILRDSFLTLESNLKLSLELNGAGNEEDLLGEGDEDMRSHQGSSSKRRSDKRTLFLKVQGFVNSETELNMQSERLNAGGTSSRGSATGGRHRYKGKFSGKRDGGSAAVDTLISTTAAAKGVRAANKVWATALKNEDKSVCFEYIQTNGFCSKGDACRYNHDEQRTPAALASAIADSGSKTRQVWCKDFLNGKCQFGDKCRFVHPGAASRGEGASAVAAASVSKQQQAELASQKTTPNAAGVGGAATQGASDLNGAGKAQKSAASRIMFALGKGDSPISSNTFARLAVDSDSSGEDEQVRMVIEKPAHQERVMSVVVPEISTVLGWDSMSSLHVASDVRVLDDATELRDKREAVGVGGSLPITHEGSSSLFGLEKMCVINHGVGSTPNLMSVGRALQPDKRGCPGIAVFTDRGAVRVRATESAQRRMSELIDALDREGLIEGTAIQRNFVYEENCAEAPWPSSDFTSKVERSYKISVKMYDDRVNLDDADDAVQFLVASGVSKVALLGSVGDDPILLGVPEVVTKEKLDHYFQYVGKDIDQLEAEVTSAPIRAPAGILVTKCTFPGEGMQLDNVDPSFSRLKTLEREEVKGRGSVLRSVSTVIPSLGGFKDAVVAVDIATGYVELEGRATKKNPHLTAARFMGSWQDRWPNKLRVVRADKEFSGPEVAVMVRRLPGGAGHLSQSIPGDHRRNTGMIEGVLRWLQDTAQGNMNRLRPLIKNGTIDELQARSLWFHALRMSGIAWNLRPSLLAASKKTRYEEGTGIKASLSDIVMMPFGFVIVGKKLRDDADGRGSACLYVGPSMAVRGGIITYNLHTKALAVKFAFLPVPQVMPASRTRLELTRRLLYGRSVSVPPGTVPVDFNENAPPVVHHEVTADVGSVNNEVSCDILASDQLVLEIIAPEAHALCGNEQMCEAQGGKDSAAPLGPRVGIDLSVGVATSSSILAAPNESVLAEAPDIEVPTNVEVPSSLKTRGGVNTRPKRDTVTSNYGTRSKRGASPEVVCEVSEELASARPPKPKVPSNKVCANCLLWQAADAREASKLASEDTLHNLPVDERGVSVRPADAIVLRLLRVREYKWKEDPDTGDMRWLECVRFVCDGSLDKRTEINYYAETPDRTLLFLMTSIGASLGEHATTSDVTRAYLNALSIDRNIVIIAAKDMLGLPRESLLNKGLYGSRGGALGWQMWIDDKLKGLDFQKLDVARGVYVKDMPCGETLRTLRHSDDFRMSSLNAEEQTAEEAKLREQVRMSEFMEFERFLGCTFEYINSKTGKPDSKGTLVLVRQREKIAEMRDKFRHLHDEYNPNNRLRKVPLPLTAIRQDDELDGELGELLDDQKKGDFQSLVGCGGWVAGSTRPDVKLGCFVISQRLSAPRVWDMFLAVWVMDYLVGTIDAPLVLGGDIIDPEVHADASFATLKERRSLVAHLATTGTGSGAIYAHVGATKCAVSSVWEAEIVAGCESVDTAVYLTSVCNELRYPVDGCRRVRVDNQAEVDWFSGSAPSRRSRHIDIKYYRAKHQHEGGAVSIEFIGTEDNVADILTKPLPVEVFRKHARTILGHELIAGLGILGEIIL